MFQRFVVVVVVEELNGADWAELQKVKDRWRRAKEMKCRFCQKMEFCKSALYSTNAHEVAPPEV